MQEMLGLMVPERKSRTECGCVGHTWTRLPFAFRLLEPLPGDGGFALRSYPGEEGGGWFVGAAFLAGQFRFGRYEPPPRGWPREVIESLNSRKG
jgi:hypothetical protein